MGPRVEKPVRVVLHSHRRHVLFLRSVLVHVPPGDEGEQRRKGGARLRLGLEISRRGECARRPLRSGRGHFLNPGDQNDLRRARGNCRYPLPDREAARGARPLHPGARHRTQPRGVGDHRRQVVLPREGMTREIAQKKGVDPAGVDPGVLYCRPACLRPQPDHALGAHPERGPPRACDGDASPRLCAQGTIPGRRGYRQTALP